MVEAVRRVEMEDGGREAARLYDVPVETLRRRVNGAVTLILIANLDPLLF